MFLEASLPPEQAIQQLVFFLLRHKGQNGFADHLLPRRAQDSGHVFVSEYRLAFSVDRPDPLLSGFHELPVGGFEGVALAQSLFHQHIHEEGAQGNEQNSLRL